MDEQNIYTNSILTFAFTSDGQIIVRKDREGKLDTFINYFALTNFLFSVCISLTLCCIEISFTS